MKRSAAIGAIIVVAVLGVLLFGTGTGKRAGDQVGIGSIVPLTGPAAELGAYNLNAANLFVSEFNQSKSPTLHLTAEDSKSVPKDGLLALQALFAKSDPVAVMVHQGSVSVALAPELAKRGKIMFYIGATPEPKAVAPLAFRMYPDPKQVAERTVDQIMVPQGLRRLAILWVNDEFGLAVAEAFRARARTAGLELVLDEDYLADTADFRTTLLKVREATPDALYIVGVGAALGRVIAQSREIGFTGAVISGPELQFADALKVAGQAAEGAQFLDLAYDPRSQESPTKEFVKAYEARYGKTPNAASAFVYDAWSIFAAALKRAASTKPEDVAAAIVAMGEYKGVCGPITLTKDRDLVFTMRTREIRNGKPEWK